MRKNLLVLMNIVIITRVELIVRENAFLYSPASSPAAMMSSKKESTIDKELGKYNNKLVYDCHCLLRY